MPDEPQIADDDYLENVKAAGAEPDYQRVGRYVTRRLAAMPELTLTEVIERSGVSPKTWQRARAGERIVQPAKMAGISRALGWTADSIELIAYGAEPKMAADTLPGLDPTVITLLAQLQERIDQLALRVLFLERRGGTPGSPADAPDPQ